MSLEDRATGAHQRAPVALVQVLTGTYGSRPHPTGVQGTGEPPAFWVHVPKVQVHVLSVGPYGGLGQAVQTLVDVHSPGSASPQSCADSVQASMGVQ